MRLISYQFCIVRVCIKFASSPFLCTAAALWPSSLLCRCPSLLLASLQLSLEESARPITAGLCWIHTASQLQKTPGVNPPLFSSKDDDEEGRRPTTTSQTTVLLSDVATNATLIFRQQAFCLYLDHRWTSLSIIARNNYSAGCYKHS